MKNILLLSISFSLFSILPHASMAATPFSVPATFDLAGSEVSFVVNLQTRRLGTVEMGLDPNPSSVTGAIDIQQLDKLTGDFIGAFQGITATTTANAQLLDLSIPITIRLESDSVTGRFFWSKDKVVFDTTAIMATLSFGSQTWDIPIYGLLFPANYSNELLTIQTNIEYSDTYMGYDFTIQIGINLKGNLKAQATGSPWIELQTDRIIYATSDNLKLYASLANPGATRNVDLYLALLAPNGTAYFFTDYTSDITPVITNWEFVSGIYLPSTLVHDIVTPATLPPISTPGTYQFLAAFFIPGTFDLIGELAVAEFTYGAASSYSCDGIWTGSGHSAVVNSDCPALANVHLEILNSQIVEGWGDEAIEIDADGYEITGYINENGQVVDGTLWEEFGPNLVAVGTFNGTFSGNAGSGTWQDAYGCYGTFSVTKME